MKLHVVALLVFSFVGTGLAEDWGKDACKRAQKNSAHFGAYYSEGLGMADFMGANSSKAIILATVLVTDPVRSWICDIKKRKRLSQTEADQRFKSMEEMLRSGYLPIIVRIQNRKSQIGGNWGGDAGDVQDVFLQSKKDPENVFLREARQGREEVFRGLSDATLQWMGTDAVLYFPADPAFFQTVATQKGRVELQVYYGGTPRKLRFGKKFAPMILEELRALGLAP